MSADVLETRDHVVWIRDRYPDTVFGDLTNMDPFTVDAIRATGIDPFFYKYEEESCMSRKPQVDYDRLEVGDLLWWNDIEEPKPTWHEVVVTHLYGGIVFYKCTDGYRSEEGDLWSPKGSIGFYLGLYPKKVIIPKGTKWTCHCPLVEFEEER